MWQERGLRTEGPDQTEAVGYIKRLQSLPVRDQAEGRVLFSLRATEFIQVTANAMLGKLVMRQATNCLFGFNAAPPP